MIEVSGRYADLPRNYSFYFLGGGGFPFRMINPNYTPDPKIAEEDEKRRNENNGV